MYHLACVMVETVWHLASWFKSSSLFRQYVNVRSVVSEKISLTHPRAKKAFWQNPQYKDKRKNWAHRCAFKLQAHNNDLHHSPNLWVSCVCAVWHIVPNRWTATDWSSVPPQFHHVGQKHLWRHLLGASLEFWVWLSESPDYSRRET